MTQEILPNDLTGSTENVSTPFLGLSKQSLGNRFQTRRLPAGGERQSSRRASSASVDSRCWAGPAAPYIAVTILQRCKVTEGPGGQQGPMWDGDRTQLKLGGLPGCPASCFHPQSPFFLPFLPPLGSPSL